MKLLKTSDIIFYAKGLSAHSSIEESTAFTIYKDIDFYEFCEKTTLATIKIDLPKLIKELNLNAKKFADEMFRYGYDIFMAELGQVGKKEQFYLTKIGFTNANKFMPNA